METMTELKRLVGVKTSRHDREPRLFIAENNGVVWATNSYWMVRAERVAPLLQHYDFKCYEPQSYEVNGTVTAIDSQPPDVGRVVPTVPPTTEITPRVLDNREVFVRGNDAKICPWLAVLDNDGEPVFVNERYLTFVVGDVDKVTFRQEKVLGVIAVYDAAFFVDNATNGLLGLVMPVRLPVRS